MYTLRPNLRPPLALCSVLAALTLILSPIMSSTSFAQDDAASGDDSLTPAAPAAPAAPTNVEATDNPNDGGGAVYVTWSLSTDDSNGAIDGYVVYRATSPSGPFKKVGEAGSGKTSSTDNQTNDKTEYYYRVDAIRNYLDAAGEKALVAGASVPWGPVVSGQQWFNSYRTITLLLFLIVTFSILQFISQAKSGKSYLWVMNVIFIVGLGVFVETPWILILVVMLGLSLFRNDIFGGAEIFVRKIAGIDAVEEAVGRATEMGKKIFFIPGIQDMNDVQTIAGMAILGRVAAVAAEYETWLEVPVSKSMVMVTARETMKEAYSRVGRPDLFQEAQVHFVTEDQFGYAAALDGMFIREKPATIFYMGAFFAESLILAETGNEAGAIQIAGTAMPSQLPFFVAACDYTLIGEELFAASAYLSREPRQLGSLKGQDVGKAIFLSALIVGSIIVLAGALTEIPNWMYLADYFSVR